MLSKICLYTSLLFSGSDYKEPCDLSGIYSCYNYYKTGWELVKQPDYSESFIPEHEYVFTDTGLYVFNLVAIADYNGNLWKHTMLTDSILVGPSPDYYNDAYVVCAGKEFLPYAEITTEVMTWDTFPQLPSTYSVITKNEFCELQEQFIVMPSDCGDDVYNPSDYNIFIPNVYSPNGDGNFDTYEMLYPSNCTLLKLSVYDLNSGNEIKGCDWERGNVEPGVYAVTALFNVDTENKEFFQNVIVIK